MSDNVLKELECGETGAKGDYSIEVPAWIIAHLARHFGTMQEIYNAFPNDDDPQPQIYLFRHVALLADEIERRESKPIANRKRDFSKNILK